MDPLGLFSTPAAIAGKSDEELFEYYYDDNYYDYADNRRLDFENYASESVPYYQTFHQGEDGEQGYLLKGIANKPFSRRSGIFNFFSYIFSS